MVFLQQNIPALHPTSPLAQDIVPFPAIASMRLVNAPRGRTGSCRPRSRRRRWFGGRLEAGWTVLASRAIPQGVGVHQLFWEYHLPISTCQAKSWNNIIHNNCWHRWKVLGHVDVEAYFFLEMTMFQGPLVVLQVSRISKAFCIPSSDFHWMPL